MNRSQGVFARNASGLVRELTAFDAFNLVFSAVLIPVGISQALGFAPAAFQGANIVISFLVAAALMLFFGIVYVLLTVCMPRSGGDYVWVSRILSPALGFVVNVTLTFVFLTWVSFNFTTMLSYFGPALIYVWGLPDSAADVLARPSVQLLVSTVLTALFAWLMVYGTRRAAAFMRWMFAIVWLGMAFWLIGLARTSPEYVAASFQSLSGHTPDEIIAIARSMGYRGGTSSDWQMTLFAMIYTFQVYTGFQWTAYFAGEVRDVRRTAVTSILGALAVSALVYTLGSGLVYRAYGYEFFNALVYIGFNDASKLPEGVPYVLPALVKFLALPDAVKYYVALAFALSIIWWTPTGFMLGTRNLFAWAFDRLLPESLADVSPRYHTPVKAIAAIAAVIAVLNVLNIYFGLSAFLVNIIAVMALAFVVIAIAGALFPYRRPDLYRDAPPVVRTSVGGLPLLTLAGIVSAAAWLFVLAVALRTPSFGLKIEWASMAQAFAVPVLAALYYAIVARRRRAAGFDLAVAFRAIPPE